MRAFVSPTARRALCAAAAGFLAAAPAHAQRPGRTVAVLGRVIDSLRQPITGANISIAPLGLATVTDAYGRFSLAGVSDGVHVLSVRKIGYGPIDIAIATPRDSSLAPVILVPGAVVLKTIVTRTVGLFDKPARLAYTSKYDAFYERRAYNVGNARFYTHEDIDRMGVQDFKDLLRRVPSLQFWDDGGNTVLSFPGCGNGGILIELNGMQVWPRGQAGSSDATLAPRSAAYVDGNPDPNRNAVDPLEPFRTMRANDVEAMELYPTSSALPADAVGNACAAIFVWSR
ncbi:MAG TPA: carboxypeptidase regulatory-like domain-containing protein [Gemmatimonadaceae bacterium]|nr:carboxypeptidase regulatory-like domain-containing protein [Gemmatimonadaceae bacterium]